MTSCRRMVASRLRRASTTSARWPRTVEGCIALLEALAPEFRRSEVESLDELSVAVAWVGEADPLVAARVGKAASHFPRRHDIDWPRASIDAAFMREVADVHRELYAENAELYGEEVAVKIERCLAVTDSEATHVAARTRAVPRAMRPRAWQFRPAGDADTRVRGAGDRHRRHHASHHADSQHAAFQRTRLAGAGTALRARRERSAGVSATRRPSRLRCACSSGGHVAGIPRSRDSRHVETADNAGDGTSCRRTSDHARAGYAGKRRRSFRARLCALPRTFAPSSSGPTRPLVTSSHARRRSRGALLPARRDTSSFCRSARCSAGTESSGTMPL